LVGAAPAAVTLAKDAVTGIKEAAAEAKAVNKPENMTKRMTILAKQTEADIKPETTPADALAIFWLRRMSLKNLHSKQLTLTSSSPSMTGR
jgi:lipopolysaccharide biosynthesis protein